jgi:hypothetical protein
MARFEQLHVGNLHMDGAVSLTAAYTIPEEANNRTYVLNAAAGIAVTLPTPKAGKRFKFIVGTIPATGAYTVVSKGGANVIQGLQNVNNTLVPGSDEDTITFAQTNADIGDFVELVSDGTNWFASGQSFAASSFTFTAT